MCWVLQRVNFLAALGTRRQVPHTFRLHSNLPVLIMKMPYNAQTAFLTHKAVNQRISLQQICMALSCFQWPSLYKNTWLISAKIDVITEKRRYPHILPMHIARLIACVPHYHSWTILLYSESRVLSTAFINGNTLERHSISLSWFSLQNEPSEGGLRLPLAGT